MFSKHAPVAAPACIFIPKKKEGIQMGGREWNGKEGQIIQEGNMRAKLITKAEEVHESKLFRAQTW